MSIKRRDTKNRILQIGESQRPDGRYVYKYTDLNGQVKFIYSWKLVKTDVTPAGKKDDLALREKKKQIQKDIFDKIVPNGGDMTVLDLVNKYLLQKTGVRHTTEAGYKTVVNILKKEDFAKQRIDRVKISDAKCWLIDLQKRGRSYSSIHNIRGVLRPAFAMAVDDDLIRKNPFDFMLASVVVNDSVTRQAVTPAQQRKFLKFVKYDNHYSKYYAGMYVLFNTGMRVSEFCGLTLSDLDMDNRMINIDHQLQRTHQMEMLIVPTKTSSGTRKIPMTDDVYETFKMILNNRKPPKVETIIDGKSGFLYYNQKGKPMVAEEWAKKFKGALDKYNSIYKEPLPKITPHVCRHTYCSRMALAGTNPKVLQYLMGHSDISVTLNTYTHLKYEDAKDEVGRVLEFKKAQ